MQNVWFEKLNMATVLLFLKVHLTPKFFFAKTNPLIAWFVPLQKFFDLVKTSIFYALLNATIISSSAEQWEIWDEQEL